MSALEYLTEVASKYSIEDVAKEAEELQAHSPSVQAAGALFWALFWKEFLIKRYVRNDRDKG